MWLLAMLTGKPQHVMVVAIPWEDSFIEILDKARKTCYNNTVVKKRASAFRLLPKFGLLFRHSFYTAEEKVL